VSLSPNLGNKVSAVANSTTMADTDSSWSGSGRPLPRLSPKSDSHDLSGDEVDAHSHDIMANDDAQTFHSSSQGDDNSGVDADEDGVPEAVVFHSDPPADNMSSNGADAGEESEFHSSQPSGTSASAEDQSSEASEVPFHQIPEICKPCGGHQHADDFFRNSNLQFHRQGRPESHFEMDGQDASGEQRCASWCPSTGDRCEIFHVYHHSFTSHGTCDGCEIFHVCHHLQTPLHHNLLTFCLFPCFDTVR